MDFYSYMTGKLPTIAMDEAEGWKSDPFVVRIKEYFGCEDDYFPEDTYEEIERRLEREVTLDTTNLGMSGDTMARDRQHDAVLLLVKTGDPECIRLAHEFGEFLMTPPNKLPKGVKKGEREGRRKRLVKYMAEAALKFQDVIHALENNHVTIQK